MPAPRPTPSTPRAPGPAPRALHGMPILLKGNIGTADRTTTTAGSLALRGSIPSADAFVARRLREAGAVLVGKTNLSEWANFRSTPRRAAGARAAASAATPTPSTGTLRVQFRIGGRGRGQPRAGGDRHGDRRVDRLSGSANGIVGIKPTSASSAGPASSPSRTARTPRGRWRSPCATPRSCWGCWRDPTPATPPRQRARSGACATTRRTSTPTGWRGRASASRAASRDSTNGRRPAGGRPRRDAGARGRDRGSGRALAHACGPGPGPRSRCCSTSSRPT